MWNGMQRDTSGTSYLFPIYLDIFVLLFNKNTVSKNYILGTLFTCQGTVKAFPFTIDSIMCPGQGPCAILLPCLNKASLKDMGIWVFSHFQWPCSNKQYNIPLQPLIIKDCHACLTTWGALSVLLSLFWMLMCNQPHQRTLWPNYRGYEPYVLWQSLQVPLWVKNWTTHFPPPLCWIV